MDTESQKVFDTLVRRRPQDLNETEIAFLRSRESYLSESERITFAAILTSEEVKPEKSEKPKKGEK